LQDRHCDIFDTGSILAVKLPGAALREIRRDPGHAAPFTRRARVDPACPRAGRKWRRHAVEPYQRYPRRTTMQIQSMKRVFSAMLIISLVGVTTPMPAFAAMVGTDRVIATEQNREHIDRVSEFLARDDVAQELQNYGVEPADAQARVQAMTPQELTQLSAEIDQLPAGSGALAIIGVVFVVLLILELVGVTNIFSAI
jgi:hypothetical protein